MGHDPYEFAISTTNDLSSIKVDVCGPFFNDPACPSSPPGEPCDELWEYEGNKSSHSNNVNMMLNINIG